MTVNKKILSCCIAAALLITTFVSANSADKNNGKSTAGGVIPNSAITDIEVNSNRHTRADEVSAQVVNHLDTVGFEKKLSNERFDVWFSEETRGIRITDRQNGYIWGALAEAEPEDMNQSWSAMANSLCTVEYFNDVYAEKRISISDNKAKTKFIWEDSALKCSVNFKKLGIAFSFTLELLEDGLRISVDKGSLEETGDCYIKSLYFMPFLGCCREDEIDGYMFIPDGPGALIRYEKASDYVSGFTGKVYGLDMGIDSLTVASDLQANRTNDYLVDPPQVTMPVFGMVHGVRRNAILSVIESGEQYSNIVASVAGAQTNYYWTTARFDYRQLYVHATGSDGQGVYQAQEKPENMQPTIRYYFLTGEKADYSGMAVSYREYLKEKGVLKREREDSSLPLRLNVVGAEIKEGVLFNTTKAFTTVAQATKMTETLSKDGISNLTLVYEGWQNGGINGSKYGETSFENKLGSKGDFERLKALVEKNGGRFYLQSNPITANKDQINSKKDAAITISNTLARFVRANNKVMYNESFLIKPTDAADAIEKHFDKLKDFSFSFGQIGSRLYADHTRKSANDRVTVRKMFEKALSKADKLALSQVNQYLWKYTDEYFDIPTTNSQYLYETDTVPFLQMVLKGSIDYYAPYANQGFYSEVSILKMIEYGCYPSFMVTALDNFSLTDTPLEDYFSLNFEDWRDTVNNVYSKLALALEAVEGKTISEHRMLADGVVKITYEGGTEIYVNYNNTEFTSDGVTVAPQGYAVKE